MHHIRPHKLFDAAAASPSGRIVQTALPKGRAKGGITLLETFLITAANRIVSARRVFEFGTFRGGTTFNLALNIPDDGTVFTLDLDAASACLAEQDAADAPLTEIHLASKASLDFAGSSTEGKIKTLTGNSVSFDFRPWHESIDLAFIDGGHDLETVQSDSANAFLMVCRSQASCIIWHDYRNRDYPSLSDYLDGLSVREHLFHLEDTMLCAWFNDPTGKILPLLL